MHQSEDAVHVLETAISEDLVSNFVSIFLESTDYYLTQGAAIDVRNVKFQKNS